MQSPFMVIVFFVLPESQWGKEDKNSFCCSPLNTLKKKKIHLP